MSESTKPALNTTEEQLAAITATKKGGASLMLEAYAGCGKTTTLGMLAREVRGPALALAFNKSIAEELRGKFPQNFEVQTMNALGFRALRRGLAGVTTWKIDPKKVGTLITEKSKKEKLQLSGDDWEGVRKIATGAQLAGLDGTDEDDFASWQEIAAEAWVEEAQIDRLVDIAREVLQENNELTRKGLISFDDQVYYPVAFGLRFARYPTLMVDEAQDLNQLNHRILVASAADRLIVCGDPRQSIYGFRGSVNESMAQIRWAAPRWEDLRLTLTFRCPRLVVERQQAHAPGYRAADANPEGFVDNWRAPWGHPEGQPWESWGFAKMTLSRPPGDNPSMAVLCRNNAPLMGLAFRLIRQGIGVRMLGQDIGKALSALSKKISKEDRTPADAFVGLVRDWMAKEMEAARRGSHEERVSAIVDRGECLIAVAEGGARNAGEVRSAIEKLFSATGGLITLSSIHKSKGLEWDLVLHLDPWRIPSKYARLRAAEGDASQLQQEANLKYVCETRTRHTLIEANLEDFA